jgi:hypothetical protein
MLDVVQSHFGALSYWLVEIFGGKCLPKNILGGESIEGLPSDGGGGTCCM